MERVTGRSRKFVGFVRGWGQKKGAAATTLCWDVGGILAIGADDADLARAINRLIQIQGGLVLMADGHLLAELPLPVMGYISEMKMPEIAERLKSFQDSFAGSRRGNAFRPTYDERHDHRGHPVYAHDGKGVLPLQGRRHRGAVKLYFHTSSTTWPSNSTTWPFRNLHLFRNSV